MTEDRRNRGRLPSLSRDTRGVTALIFGLMAVPLALAAGMAVDLGVAYYLKTRLAFAVDAAALAVGSTIGEDADLDLRAANFFNANYPEDAIGDTHDLLVSVEGDVITVSAAATFDTFFMKIVNRNTITVRASAEVIRAIKGLEVALVLDNTGSMRGHNNIGALRVAAEDMVDILFGSETTHPNLFVSIVPYAASVNPGPEAFGGVQTPTQPEWWPKSSDPGYVAFTYTPENLSDSNDPMNGQGWKGCVIERTGADRMDDNNSDGWQPYTWAPDASNNYEIDNMTDTVRYDPSVWKNNGAGPNLGCPSRIIPLTNVKNTLVTYIRSLEAWHRGGTLGDIGMAWGRRVLSPQAPFTEGQPYDKEGWEKAIVMMTDGRNQVYKLTNTETSASSNNNKQEHSVNSDFTGYEWLDTANPHFGTSSRSVGEDVVNDRLADICEDIKALGIIIYTVTFTSSVNDDTKKIYKNCASDLTKWFDSPTQQDLKNSFKAIAIELSKLRVSR